MHAPRLEQPAERGAEPYELKRPSQSESLSGPGITRFTDNPRDRELLCSRASAFAARVRSSPVAARARVVMSLFFIPAFDTSLHQGGVAGATRSDRRHFRSVVFASTPKDGSEMNPYAVVSSGVGTIEAASLRSRLMAWHDAMVAHERQLRSHFTTDSCGDGCPHAEARGLWAEVSAMLGPRAGELTFLRSRALGASASSQRRTSGSRRSESFSNSPEPSRLAPAELRATT